MSYVWFAASYGTHKTELNYENVIKMLYWKFQKLSYLNSIGFNKMREN